MWQIFLSAWLNDKYGKKFFDNDFPSPCFNVPKASNFTSSGVQNRKTKNGRLGMIVTDYSVIFLLWANKFAKKLYKSALFIRKSENVREICFIGDWRPLQLRNSGCFEVGSQSPSWLYLLEARKRWVLSSSVEPNLVIQQSTGLEFDCMVLTMNHWALCHSLLNIVCRVQCWHGWML